MGLGPGNTEKADKQVVPTCDVAVTLGADFDLTAQFTCGYARELFIGTAGNVVAVMKDSGGVAVTYKNLASGTTLSGCFVTVKSTGNGTTASDIVARR